jgi:hypothetical protein
MRKSIVKYNTFFSQVAVAKGSSRAITLSWPGIGRFAIFRANAEKVTVSECKLIT